MSTPNAQPAQGAVLSYTENGTVWSVVGNVLSVKGVGGGEMGKRETTVLASTIHTWRPTIPTKGPFSFHFLFDPQDPTHQAVRDMATVPLSNDPQWKVAFNISTAPNSCTFTGFVENFDGPNADDVDANLEAEVTIVVNSVPTWA